MDPFHDYFSLSFFVYFFFERPIGKETCVKVPGHFLNGSGDSCFKNMAVVTVV